MRAPLRTRVQLRTRAPRRTEALPFLPPTYTLLWTNADVSLTVQPSDTLTADDADASLQEASYTEDTEATVGEIETFAMEDGTEAGRLK